MAQFNSVEPKTSKSYRIYCPNRRLFAAILWKWLSDDRPAYFIREAAYRLDLSELQSATSGRAESGPPHDLIVKALVYGYCVGAVAGEPERGGDRRGSEHPLRGGFART